MSTPQKRKLSRTFGVTEGATDDPDALRCTLQEVKTPPDWIHATGKFNLRVFKAYDADTDPAPILEAISRNDTLIYPPTIGTKESEKDTIIVPVYTAKSLDSVRRTIADVLKKPLGKASGFKPGTPKIITEQKGTTMVVSGACKCLKRWMLDESGLNGTLEDENKSGPQAEFNIPITDECDADDIKAFMDDLCRVKGFAIEHKTPPYEPTPPSTTSLQPLTPAQAYHYTDEENGRPTIRDVLSIFKDMGAQEEDIQKERLRLMTDMTYYKEWVVNFDSWVLPIEEPQPVEMWTGLHM